MEEENRLVLADADTERLVYEANAPLFINNLIPCDETYKVFLKFKILQPSTMLDLKNFPTRTEKNQKILDHIIKRNLPVHRLVEALEESGHHMMAQHFRLEAMKEEVFDINNVIRLCPELEVLLPSERVRRFLQEYLLQKLKEAKASTWYKQNRMVDQKWTIVSEKHMRDAKAIRAQMDGQKNQVQGQKNELAEYLELINKKDSELRNLKASISGMQENHERALGNLLKHNDANHRVLTKQKEEIKQQEDKMWSFFDQLKSYIEEKNLANVKSELNADDEIREPFLKSHEKAEKSLKTVFDRVAYLEKCKESFENLLKEVEATLAYLQEKPDTMISLAVRRANIKFRIRIDELLDQIQDLRDQVIGLENIKDNCEVRLRDLKNKENLIQTLRYKLKNCAGRNDALEQELRHYMKLIKKLLIDNIPNQTTETKAPSVLTLGQSGAASDTQQKTTERNTSDQSLTFPPGKLKGVPELLKHTDELLKRKQFAHILVEEVANRLADGVEEREVDADDDKGGVIYDSSDVKQRRGSRSEEKSKSTGKSSSSDKREEYGISKESMEAARKGYRKSASSRHPGQDGSSSGDKMYSNSGYGFDTRQGKSDSDDVGVQDHKSDARYAVGEASEEFDGMGMMGTTRRGSKPTMPNYAVEEQIQRQAGRAHEPDGPLYLKTNKRRGSNVGATGAYHEGRKPSINTGKSGERRGSKLATGGETDEGHAGKVAKSHNHTRRTSKVGESKRGNIPAIERHHHRRGSHGMPTQSEHVQHTTDGEVENGRTSSQMPNAASSALLDDRQLQVPPPTPTGGSLSDVQLEKVLDAVMKTLLEGDIDDDVKYEMLRRVKSEMKKDNRSKVPSDPVDLEDFPNMSDEEIRLREKMTSGAVTTTAFWNQEKAERAIPYGAYNTQLGLTREQRHAKQHHTNMANKLEKTTQEMDQRFDESGQRYDEERAQEKGGASGVDDRRQSTGAAQRKKEFKQGFNAGTGVGHMRHGEGSSEDNESKRTSLDSFDKRNANLRDTRRPSIDTRTTRLRAETIKKMKDFSPDDHKKMFPRGTEIMETSKSMVTTVREMINLVYQQPILPPISPSSGGNEEQVQNNQIRLNVTEHNNTSVVVDESYLSDCSDSNINVNNNFYDINVSKVRINTNANNNFSKTRLSKRGPVDQDTDERRISRKSSRDQSNSWQSVSMHGVASRESTNDVEEELDQVESRFDIDVNPQTSFQRLVNEIRSTREQGSTSVMSRREYEQKYHRLIPVKNMGRYYGNKKGEKGLRPPFRYTYEDMPESIERPDKNIDEFDFKKIKKFSHEYGVIKKHEVDEHQRLLGEKTEGNFPPDLDVNENVDQEELDFGHVEFNEEFLHAIKDIGHETSARDAADLRDRSTGAESSVVPEEAQQAPQRLLDKVNETSSLATSTTAKTVESMTLEELVNLKKPSWVSVHSLPKGAPIKYRYLYGDKKSSRPRRHVTGPTKHKATSQGASDARRNPVTPTATPVTTPSPDHAAKTAPWIRDPPRVLRDHRRTSVSAAVNPHWTSAVHPGRTSTATSHIQPIDSRWKPSELDNQSIDSLRKISEHPGSAYTVTSKIHSVDSRRTPDIQSIRAPLATPEVHNELE